MKKLLLALSLISLLSCSSQTETDEKAPVPEPYSFSWQTLNSGVDASLRGLSVVDSLVVWASGTSGTFLRTTDGGATWKTGTIPGADTVDFRDIAGFDRETAYVVSAGSPAMILKTMDGGDTWLKLYENDNPEIFFDAFDFRDENHGLAMSDPIEGQFVLIHTEDGDTWQEVPPQSIPDATEGEAGFAASGTGVVLQSEKLAWFATGGKRSRVFRSTDGGTHWEASEVPLIQGAASTGIFSMVMADSLQGIAIGGDYLQPEVSDKISCFTRDGGKTWELSKAYPSGYRSGAAYQPKFQLYMTVGTNGSDYSVDGGQHWSPVDTAAYHAIQFAPGSTIGFASGGKGKLARVQISPNQ